MGPKIIAKKPSLAVRAAFQFPPAWLWLVDEMIPILVKRNYSPREAWKNKPFTKEDSIFFSKGVEELSELFTTERSRGVPSYFQHPRFRSSYLLYFLPLQMAKFLSLFHSHYLAMDAMLAHAKGSGKISILDVGSGPGTASLALLLWLLDQKNFPRDQELPPIELHWIDTNSATMEDGKVLVRELCNQFPRLRDKVTLKTFAKPWWEVRMEGEYSLGFWGHVLNESKTSRSQAILSRAMKEMQGGGFLFIEPASRTPSQTLSQLRDSGIGEETITSIWGPCLHLERCPLAVGRDWCHFSMPVEIPGKWFKSLSKFLSSEKHWIKFSYLWAAAAQYPAPKASVSLRRVISDPLRKGPGPSSVLLCEPEVPGKLSVGARERVGRGDLVDLDLIVGVGSR